MKCSVCKQYVGGNAFVKDRWHGGKIKVLPAHNDKHGKFCAGSGLRGK